MTEINKLILGDNLGALKRINRDTVDLIYLDPPFFGNRNYEIIWGDSGEIRSFILKPTDSISLHCNWHADAYIRVEILEKFLGVTILKVI